MLPPGQEPRDALPVRHYGPVPKVRDPGSWAMQFTGHTASGEQHQITVAELAELPQTRFRADLHCAGKWTVRDNDWEGVLTRDLVKLFPPAPNVDEVIAYAQYGYSANVTLADLTEHDALVATRLNGAPLEPEHGFPARLVVPHLYSWKGPKWFRGWEYLDHFRRGFWEERGYHREGDPWQEERYSYQER